MGRVDRLDRTHVAHVITRLRRGDLAVPRGHPSGWMLSVLVGDVLPLAPADGNPVTVVDGGLNDADGSTGQLQLINVCRGAYTITEAFSPSGLAVDGDPTRAVDVTLVASDTVGTQGTNQDARRPRRTTMPTPLGQRRDRLLQHRRPRAADQLGEAAPERHRERQRGQFRVRRDVRSLGLEWSTRLSRPDRDPLVVVDDGPSTRSRRRPVHVEPVCSGICTITETIAPRVLRRPGPDSMVNVTTGNDSVSGSGCPDSTPATDTEEDDFCNPQTIVGSIAWEKRSNVNGALQGGATFTVAGGSGPFRLLRRNDRHRSPSSTTASTTSIRMPARFCSRTSARGPTR